MTDETDEFECPRCRQPVREMYYGPCSACRGELAEKYAGLGRDVERSDFVPKMNVTPNAVALKDD